MVDLCRGQAGRDEEVMREESKNQRLREPRGSSLTFLAHAVCFAFLTLHIFLSIFIFQKSHGLRRLSSIQKLCIFYGLSQSRVSVSTSLPLPHPCLTFASPLPHPCFTPASPLPHHCLTPASPLLPPASPLPSLLPHPCFTPAFFPSHSLVSRFHSGRNSQCHN